MPARASSSRVNEAASDFAEAQWLLEELQSLYRAASCGRRWPSSTAAMRSRG